MSRQHLTITLVVDVEEDATVGPRLFDLDDAVPELQHFGPQVADHAMDMIVRRLDILGYSPVRVSTGVALSSLPDPF